MVDLGIGVDLTAPAGRLTGGDGGPPRPVRRSGAWSGSQTANCESSLLNGTNPAHAWPHRDRRPCDLCGTGVQAVFDVSDVRVTESRHRNHPAGRVRRRGGTLPAASRKMLQMRELLTPLRCRKSAPAGQSQPGPKRGAARTGYSPEARPGPESGRRNGRPQTPRARRMIVRGLGTVMFILPRTVRAALRMGAVPPVRWQITTV